MVKFDNTENHQGSRVDLRDCIFIEIELLRSRVASLQSLDDSVMRTCDLNNNITALLIDLEQEKSKNMWLECEISRIKDEIMIIR